MKVKVTQLCPTLQPHGLYSLCISPGQNTGVDSLSLLQGIFPTQATNSGLPHCRWILYQLNHEGSPGILRWVAYPFSRVSSKPRNWTRISCIAGGFFTSWATREAPVYVMSLLFASYAAVFLRICKYLPQSRANWRPSCERGQACFVIHLLGPVIYLWFSVSPSVIGIGNFPFPVPKPQLFLVSFYQDLL